MQFRVLFAVALLVLACRPPVAEPKAYEVVKYKGKAEGVTIAFDFGDGYPQASEMWAMERRSGERTRFGLDDSGEMRFVPKNESGSKREVVLKMSMDDGPAPKIEGTTRSTASKRNSRFGRSSSSRAPTHYVAGKLDRLKRSSFMTISSGAGVERTRGLCWTIAVSCGLSRRRRTATKERSC